MQGQDRKTGVRKDIIRAREEENDSVSDTRSDKGARLKSSNEVELSIIALVPRKYARLSMPGFEQSHSAEQPSDFLLLLAGSVQHSFEPSSFSLRDRLQCNQYLTIRSAIYEPAACRSCRTEARKDLECQKCLKRQRSSLAPSRNIHHRPT